ncbi:hypothetical protein PISMIDRAFT_687192, partial [Pisolithus microcarpus 441]
MEASVRRHPFLRYFWASTFSSSLCPIKLPGHIPVPGSGSWDTTGQYGPSLSAQFDHSASGELHMAFPATVS